MNKLEEYLFLKEETEKLNYFLFGESLEEHIKQNIDEKNPYKKSMLRIAHRCDKQMNTMMKSYPKPKSLQKK